MNAVVITKEVIMTKDELMKWCRNKAIESGADENIEALAKELYDYTMSFDPPISDTTPINCEN